MNEVAYAAVERAWQLTIKARALCPYSDERAIGARGYLSSDWHRAHGAVYFVNLARPLSRADVAELNEIGSFVNRSFVISMAAILEATGVVPYGERPDLDRAGGNHVRLTKWLRNRFAHGEWEYDSASPKHVETRELLERLFPDGTSGTTGFVTSINVILEPLVEGVLAYIRASP